MKIKPWAIFLVSTFLFQLGSACAQEELSESQIEERLQYIQRTLEQGAPAANRWWYSWLIGYSTLTIAQGAIGSASMEHATRQDMSLGAATTFLGAMGQVLAPMIPGSAPDQLAGIPDKTSEEKREKLLKAEKIFRECALMEKGGRSWKTHAITGGLNLASGLIVWLGFKRSLLDGFSNFMLNTAVTELQIWTQPVRSIKDYDNYIKKCKTGQGFGYRKSEQNILVTVSPGGLRISIAF
jgi:hypothetical protein